MKNKVNYTGGGSGGSSTLADLEDVELTTPTDGQALVYDDTNSKWINGNVSGGTLVIQDASIYSTDEQQVGVWTDGRPIYKKTWIFDTYITVNQSSIFSLASKGVSISNLGVITSSEAIMTLDKRSMFPVAVGMRSGNISIFNYSGLAVDIDGITLYYTKTTDAAGSGGYKAYGLSPIIYSEEEREVGVWTDGKPLYQKTWTGLNVTPSYNSWSNVIPNDVNIETLVRWQALSNVDYKNLDGTGIEWQVYGGYVRAEYNQNANVRTIEILTLQYTKTIDTAGSGIWTTTGEYSHHYSTDEKVVGTWIDGKPIYERVFDLGSNITISYLNLTNTSIDASNMKVLVDAWGLYSTGVTKYSLMANISNNVIRLQTDRNGVDASVQYVILQYTKTTD